MYGKWAAAALAVGFTAMGVHAHNTANQRFADLLDYCGTAGCVVTTTGQYSDPGAEQRYARVVNSDRAARGYFVAGQAALAGAITLFVLELSHDDRGPRNIPYQGLIVEPGRYGVRIPFPR